MALSNIGRSSLSVASAAFALAVLAASTATASDSGEGRTSRISDESVTRLDVENFPKRPKPILELGNPFLDTGNIKPGIELPGGAVWQPSLVVFGTHRSALQSFHNGTETFTELTNRMDLFANLQLAGSERLMFGVRPLDEDGEFTGYRFEPDRTGANDKGWNGEENVAVTTLFFEGDLGEIFPDIDPSDTVALDYGFAVGRQPLNYQEGMLINDSIDLIGITRNSLLPRGGSNLQATFLFGWNDVHRNDNVERANQKLYGLVFAMDRPETTINVDFIYVEDRNGTTDGFFWGVSDARRIGHFSLSTRLLGSHALDVESATVSDGNLLFTELSWIPAWTHDHVYTNFFLGMDRFSSAARDPSTGGPLGRTGILFQAIGMGRYGAPLGNRANKSWGGAIGYQWFLSPVVNQFIFELGTRQSTDPNGDFSIAGGVRYRHVFGQHLVAQFDVFSAVNESRSDSFGGRFELRVEF